MCVSGVGLGGVGGGCSGRCNAKLFSPLDVLPVSASASVIHQPPVLINKVDWWNSERYLLVICV